MASKKRKVFFSRIQVRLMFSHEPIEDREQIKNDIFDPIIDKYNKAMESGDFSDFQSKIEGSNEIYMVSMLHYKNHNICGVVSHGSPRMQRYLCQCNPDTFDVKELVPDDGNVFEEYSFFAISITKMQMAFLNDSAVSSNIPSLVLSLLQPSVNVNYNLEEKSMLESDIKKKIKELGDSIVIQGVMQDKQKRVVGGLPALTTMEDAIRTEFEAKINIKAKIRRKLTDRDIEIIQMNATKDEGFSSFTFADEQDADKEIIDVIKNKVRTSKSIELSDEERMEPTAIWTKLCASFSMG